MQVPEKEDQMRWKAAQMLALHELQDRVCLYTGREEEKSTQRVGAVFF
jgi:hypothetical protein